MESGGGFSASFQDARFFGRGFQPQCGWLISNAPSEQSEQPLLTRDLSFDLIHFKSQQNGKPNERQT